MVALKDVDQPLHAPDMTIAVMELPMLQGLLVRKQRYCLESESAVSSTSRNALMAFTSWRDTDQGLSIPRKHEIFCSKQCRTELLTPSAPTSKSKVTCKSQQGCMSLK